MKKQLLVLFSIPVFVTPYLPDDFIDDLAEVSDQFRSFHGIHGAVVGSLRSRGRTEEQILDVLDYVMEHPDEFHPGSDGNAAGCLRLLNSTNAFLKAESLLDSDVDSVRWQATLAYRDLAFSKQYPGFDSVRRLKESINRPSKHGTEIRNWIYRGFDSELRLAGPKPERQRLILGFLVDQTRIDSQNAAKLDEILCREVPKWRASQQRAENAAKMIREHPDDARLVSFFETVRTNALESARTASPSEDENAGSPATTNQTTLASAPSADSDPWADLLDDLPEKKPWTPPPGYEPPL